MYKYKVYLTGPLGYRVVYFTNANSSLEAQANVSQYIGKLKFSRVECIGRIPEPTKDIIAIHNVIPVDFKRRKRLSI